MKKKFKIIDASTGEKLKLKERRMLVMNKQELMEIEDKGHLPWKNFKGNWCVTYLSRHAEGVCDAEFDTIFEALKFAQEIGK